MPRPDGIHLDQLNIEINGGCSYTCQSCPQASGREREFLKKLPLTTFTKIVDDAYQYRDPSKLFCVSLHGSGEPTLHPQLPEMIAYVKRKTGTYASFFTHGKHLTSRLSERIIQAGINEVTVSIIGYDRQTYQTWMTGDNLELVIGNIRSFQVAASSSNGVLINTRHLILDVSKCEEEVTLYRRNIINPLGVEAEVWMQHNWAGLLPVGYSREEMARATGVKRRTCGRPHANYLEVRAGGIGEHRAAVVPYPIILGQDSKAVLGHLDTQTIAEIVAGKPFELLRRAHEDGRFGDVAYCSNCDYLYPDLEVLVWTNKPGRKVGQSQTARSLMYPEAVTT